MDEYAYVKCSYVRVACVDNYKVNFAINLICQSIKLIELTDKTKYFSFLCKNF